MHFKKKFYLNYFHKTTTTTNNLEVSMSYNYHDDRIDTNENLGYNLSTTRINQSNNEIMNTNIIIDCNEQLLLDIIGEYSNQNSKLPQDNTKLNTTSSPIISEFQLQNIVK